VTIFFSEFQDWKSPIQEGSYEHFGAEASKT